MCERSLLTIKGGYGVSVTVEIPGEMTTDELVPIFMGIGVILGYSPDGMKELFYDNN